MSSEVEDQKSDSSPTPDIPSPRWHKWLPVILPIALLLPFLNKAFHIDDTVYIYIAQHLLHHPIDYFGFNMNWTSWLTPVYAFNKNPPGLSYFLAPFGAVFGWSEIAMHLTQLIPTIAASLGIYHLAKRLSATPLLAVITAIATPSFLVSSSVVMVEPLVLACYVWAIVLWIKASDEDAPPYYVAAALLIGFGILSKYVALTAIPLLIAYTLCRERRISRTLFYMLIPTTMLALFDLSAVFMYKQSLVGSIAGAVSSEQYDSAAMFFARKTLWGLSFTGGGFITLLFIAPVIHRRAVSGLLVLTFAAVTALVLLSTDLLQESRIYDDDGTRWTVLLQLSLMTTAGLYILGLALNDLYKHRDESALLLTLLVFGIFIFGSFLNWTVNARSLFPMLPAAAILIARQWDALEKKPSTGFIAIPLILGLIVSLAVGYGDYQYANTARNFVAQMKDDPDTDFDKTWFMGHWGFQLYMEEEGARAINWSFRKGSGVAKPEAGDTIVWWNGQYKYFPDTVRVKDIDVVNMPASNWITTMNYPTGAGFYLGALGPLPYYFGPSTPDHFIVFTVDDPPYHVEEFLPEVHVVPE